MIDAPEPRDAHPGVHGEHIGLWRRFHTLASLRTLTASGGEWAPDLSEFNGAVDMGAIKQAGAAGVILRCGFGTVREDHRWRTNRANAEAVGLPWIAYWMCYPSYNPAGSEAAAFNAVVGRLPAGCGMAADCENDPGARPWPGGSVSRDWLAAFLTAVGPSDYLPVWYCSTSFVGPHSLGSLAGTWPWWEAAYGVSAPNELGLAPKLWQETDRATVPGVPGPCDVSVVLRGTFAALLYGSTPAPAPPPPPAAPAPLLEDDMGDIAYLNATALGQQQVYWVDAAGQLLEQWYDGKAWNGPVVIATGLAPRTPVSAQAVDALKQIQVVARLADGRIVQAVADYGGWFSTVIHGVADGGLPVPGIDAAALIAALLAGLVPHLQVIDEAALLAHLDTLPPTTAAAVKAGFAKALAG